MSASLASYLVRFREDPDELARTLEHPALLLEPRVSEVEEPVFRVRTQSGAGVAPSLLGEPLLLFIIKAKENAFRRGITVGRTTNNDLIIDDSSISRFHAWFQRDQETGEWKLFDANSKNGTFLGASRLTPRKGVQLPRDARVRFGEVHARFLWPTPLIRLLRARSEQPTSL